MTPAVIQTIVPSLVEIRLDAERFPRLFRLAKPYAMKDLTAIVAQGLLYRGQDADAEKVTFIASSVYDEMIADEQHLGLMNLSIEEIRRVVKRTALDKDTFGISVATIYSALCAYAKGEGHDADVEAHKIYKEQRRQAIEPVVNALAEKFTSTHKITTK